MPKKSIHKEILALAIPNILSNISVPLMSSVDTGLMGQLSTGHLAAVGIAAMIFNMFFWTFGFLRMGTTGMTAQGFGAQDTSFISSTLMRGIVVASILGCLLILCKNIILALGVWSMSVDTSYLPYVETYFNTRIYEAPGFLLLICMMGWFFGMQNARTPLMITITLNIVNIAASYYLVAYKNMGIQGVATGTVIATYVGVFLCFVVLLSRYRSYLRAIEWKHVFQVDGFIGFLRVNSDLFKRTICLMLTFVFLYRYAASDGDTTLAVSVVMLQFINWMSYGIDGYAYAAESIVGKYKGSNDTSSLSAVVRACMIWGAAVAACYSIVYLIWGDQLVYLFSSDSQVVQIFLDMRFWIVLIPIVGFASYIWDGVYIGLLASKSMWWTMLVSFIVYLMLLWLLPNMPNARNVWIAFTLFLALRGIGQTYLYLKKGDQLS